MNPLEVKGKLLNPTAQIIVFSEEGELIYSCNALFNIREKDAVSLFNTFPVLEGLQEVFFDLAEGERLNFPCVWFEYLGVSGHFDFLFTKHDGELYWLIQDFDKIYSKLISVQQERNVSIINSEILELHKKTQEKLVKVEKAYEYLFNNTPDLIQSIDVQGNFNFTNPAWQKTLLLTEYELSQINFYNLVHPDDLSYCKQIYKSLSHKKKLKFVEFRLLDKNGQTISVRGSINLSDSEGETKSIQGIYRNVTQRKIVEQRLKQSETLYRLLVENASDIIVKISTQGKITYMNKVGLKFVRKAEEELKGVDFLDWVDNNYRKNVTEFYSNQFRKGENSTYLEFPLILNNERKWVGQNANLLFETVDGKETIVGFLLILRDVSKQKEQEDLLNRDNYLLEIKVKERTRALNKSNQELVGLNNELEENAKELIKHINELEEFSFIVSHDVRGPIARLLGLTMLFGMVDTIEHKSLTEQIEAETLSLDSIIKDLNNILQIRNDIYLTNELVNVNEEITTALKRLSIISDNADILKNIELVIEEEQVYGIGAYIQSILYNLISNSLKYKQEGRDLRIKLTCKVIKKSYLIEIIDNGKGIDLIKFEKKLFRMYSRFDMEAQGKGVGLYLVKKQVEAMNGRISVNSKVNQGSTFSIYLPIPQQDVSS